MLFNTRDLNRNDANVFQDAFLLEGRDVPMSLFLSYYTRQSRGEVKVIVAEKDGAFLGYGVIAVKSIVGPFKDKNIPAIIDINVLETNKNYGVGSFLVETMENYAKKISDIVCIAVPVNSKLGSLQIFLAKRNYLPDGTGLWYGDNNVNVGENVLNDCNLCMYLQKQIKTTRFGMDNYMY